MAYTHDVKFRLGDGSSFMDGELGIEAGELVYKITSTSQPLKANLIDDFRQFTDHVKKMALEYGGLKEVSIKKKE